MTIIIPDWVLYAICIYFIITTIIGVWKNILDEDIKKWTKRLVNNQQLIKDLRDTIEKQSVESRGKAVASSTQD